MKLVRFRFGKRYGYECQVDGVRVGSVFPRAVSGWMFCPITGAVPSVGRTRHQAIMAAAPSEEVQQ